MRKALTLCAVLAGLALAGTGAAGTSNGASVIHDAGCVTNGFATTCTVIKTVTNTTTTPSGNVSYVTNGTIERRVTFGFGGTNRSSSEIHPQMLGKQGE